MLKKKEKKQWHGKNSPTNSSSFQSYSEKKAGSGSTGIWQCHNKFLFHKLALIFPETMQVSWCYHSSSKVLNSCLWVAAFRSEIITKSDFSTLGNSVAENVSPAISVLEFLSRPLFSPFWTTICHQQSSTFHCSPLFPRSHTTLLKAFISLQPPVEVQHLPASLLIARDSYSLSASWLLKSPCKHCMFSNYGPVYSKTLNNTL